MKRLIIAAALLFSPSAMAAGFYKTVCLWNDSSHDIEFQLQFTELDPFTGKLSPRSWTSYSWYQAEGTTRTPTLRLWYTQAPGQPLNTEVAGTVLQMQPTGQERDCMKLRTTPLHYSLRNIYTVGSGEITGFELQGPSMYP